MRAKYDSVNFALRKRFIANFILKELPVAKGEKYSIFHPLLSVLDFPLDRTKEIKIISGGQKQHLPRKRRNRSGDTDSPFTQAKSHPADKKHA
jgi:hypothetical protein